VMTSPCGVVGVSRVMLVSCVMWLRAYLGPSPTPLGSLDSRGVHSTMTWLIYSPHASLFGFGGRHESGPSAVVHAACASWPPGYAGAKIRCGSRASLASMRVHDGWDTADRQRASGGGGGVLFFLAPTFRSHILPRRRLYLLIVGPGFCMCRGASIGPEEV